VYVQRFSWGGDAVDVPSDETPGLCGKEEVSLFLRSGISVLVWRPATPHHHGLRRTMGREARSNLF